VCRITHQCYTYVRGSYPIGVRWRHTRTAMLGKVLRPPGEALSPVENDVQRVCRTALVLSLLAHRAKRLVAKVFGSIEAEIDSVVSIALALNSNLSRSAYDDMRSMTGLCPSRSRLAYRSIQMFDLITSHFSRAVLILRQGHSARALLECLIILFLLYTCKEPEIQSI
jgi:hypothetical protein